MSISDGLSTAVHINNAGLKSHINVFISTIGPLVKHALGCPPSVCSTRSRGHS